MFPESNAAKNNTVVKYYLKTLSLLIPLMSYSITCYDVLNNLLNVRKLYLDVLHVPTLIGKFWKISNPRNFQTNNIEKISQEPKDRVFQELSNDVSQVPKIVNLKIAKNGEEKKKWTEYKVPPQILWVGTINWHSDNS